MVQEEEEEGFPKKQDQQDLGLAIQQKYLASHSHVQTKLAHQNHLYAHILAYETLQPKSVYRTHHILSHFVDTRKDSLK